MVRAVAIGLDAASSVLIRRLVDEGRLPTLERCGAHRAAPVGFPWVYRAELAWTRALGAGDGDHRTAVQFDPSTYGVMSGTAGVITPFGIDTVAAPSLVFDVPHLALLERESIVHVVGWGAHSPLSSRAAHPAGLLDTIDRRFGPHPAVGVDDQPAWCDPPYRRALVDALIAGADRRVDVLEWLLARYPNTEILVTAFSELHSAGHALWHEVDDAHPLHPIAVAGGAAGDRGLVAVYEAVDRALGRLLDLLGEDPVVVLFSPQGMQSNGNDVAGQLLVPELLHRLQFGSEYLHDVRSQTVRADGLPLVPAQHQRLSDMLSRRRRPNKARRVLGAVRSSAGYLQKRENPCLERGRLVPVAPAEGAKVHLGVGYQVPVWYTPRWPFSEVFALPTFSDAHLRLNVCGREAYGVVPAGRYTAALGRLERTLTQCRNPRTGAPLFSSFHRTRSHADADGPPADLVARTLTVTDALTHPDVSRIGPYPYIRTGEHTEHGWFVRVPGHGPISTTRTVGSVPDLAAMGSAISRLLTIGVNPP